MSRVADRSSVSPHTHTRIGVRCIVRRGQWQIILNSAVWAMANNFAVSHGEQRESCSGSFKCDVIPIGVRCIVRRGAMANNFE